MYNCHIEACFIFENKNMRWANKHLLVQLCILSMIGISFYFYQAYKAIMPADSAFQFQKSAEKVRKSRQKMSRQKCVNQRSARILVLARSREN